MSKIHWVVNNARAESNNACRHIHANCILGLYLTQEKPMKANLNCLLLNCLLLNFRLLTLAVPVIFFSACQIQNGVAEKTTTPAPIDEYRIEQLSKSVCSASQKLRISTDVTRLNLNNFIVAGKVKAVIFKIGTADCALKFNYNFSTNENRHSGNLSLPPDGNVTPPQAGGNYTFDLVLPNSLPEKCIINGSAWEVVTAGESNQMMVITFRNISDAATSQYMNLISDKLVTVKPLAEAIGMNLYTCQ